MLVQLGGVLPNALQLDFASGGTGLMQTSAGPSARFLPPRQIRDLLIDREIARSPGHFAEGDRDSLQLRGVAVDNKLRM